MSEIRVGAWNALNAFGDSSLSEWRMRSALDVVRRMDVDVIALPETALHGVHGKNSEAERLEELTQLMASEGYEGFATDYTSVKGERNAHYMSMWTRVGYVHDPDQPNVRSYGKRNALHLLIPDISISVRGVHFDDRYPRERVSSAEALTADVAQTSNESEAIVLGDLNEMYRDDPKGRILRAMGRVMNGIEVNDYYDPSKPLQRFVGKAVRICRMSGGDSLQVFAEAGFHDADPSHQPTIGDGRMSFQLDHILGSSGIVFTDFAVHSRHATPNGPPLSDHSPITARAIRSS